MTTEIHYFDDLEIGDEWTSLSKIVTGEDVRQFADLTGDQNRLHVDEEFAKGTPFRQPIAHGLLGLSFVAGLGSESPLLDTVAFLGVHDWKFLKPIYFGDRVYVVSRVVELEENGRKRGRVVLERNLHNQDDEIVQSGRFETLITRRVRSRRPAGVKTHEPAGLNGTSLVEAKLPSFSSRS